MIFAIALFVALAHVQVHAEVPVGWVGNFTVNISRADSIPLCDDTQKIKNEFVEFDSWARTRSVVSNLCFEVYVAGITDRAELFPGELDIFVNAPHKFNARFVEKRGNNYLYMIDLRDLDPVLHGTALSGNRKQELDLTVFAKGLPLDVPPLRILFR